ncbi:MAG TPA: hypothetical protein VNW06_08005 [Cytophagaceae bacterium]|nr:hypothetical protein [Cytophagaceae bacterium]
MEKIKSLILLLLVVTLYSCQSGSDKKYTFAEVNKTSANDPFKNTMTES